MFSLLRVHSALFCLAVVTVGCKPSNSDKTQGTTASGIQSDSLPAGTWVGECGKQADSLVKSYQVTIAFSGWFLNTTMNEYGSPSCEAQTLVKVSKIKEAITVPKNGDNSSDSTPINRLTVEKVVTHITKEAQSRANRLSLYGFSNWSQEPKDVTGKNADGSDAVGLLYDIIKVLPNKVCLGTGDQRHNGSSAEMRPIVASECYTQK